MDKTTISFALALISIIISILALCLSYARYKTIIIHNKTTVKPKLSFCLDEKDGKFVIKIKNKGQGSATLKRVKWVFNEEPVSFDKFISNFKLICEANALCFDHESNYDELAPELVIAQGETKSIFESPTMKSGEVDKFKKYFKDKYKILITYESDYGDEFKAQIPQ